MAGKVEPAFRASGAIPDILLYMSERWWTNLAAVARHPGKAPSAETRAAVIEKVRADLAAPYRAKGRG